MWDFPDFVMISIRCHPSSDYGAPSGIPSQAVARTAQNLHPGLGISSAVPPGEKDTFGLLSIKFGRMIRYDQNMLNQGADEHGVLLCA